MFSCAFVVPHPPFGSSFKTNPAFHFRANFEKGTFEDESEKKSNNKNKEDKDVDGSLITTIGML